MKTWLGSNVGDNNIDILKNTKIIQWIFTMESVLQGKNEFL